PPIYPDDPRDRATCDLIEDWADESLYFFELWFRYGLKENAGEWSKRSSQSEPPLLRRATERALPTLMRNVLKLQGIGRRTPEQVFVDFERHLGMLETWLGDGDWLVTDRLCLADIAVFSQLSYAAETGEASSVIAGYPSLLTWMERVNAETSPLS
ncbi:MAG: glutathione S-transferase family protein, partial [Sandaracinaceae bacterium]